MKKFIFIVLVLVAGGGGAWWFWFREKETAGPAWRTRVIERGTLVQEVRATGTVQPLRQVQVGTQVNGTVQKLYVDFNDTVEEGQLIAEIDPSVYEAAVMRDEASLAANRASREQILARLALSEKNLARTIQLHEREMASQADFDAAQTDVATLRAQLKLSEASIQQSEASLKTSRANLGYTRIHSPVNGVVVSRNVDEGQTVVSSMNAATLYLIATDLSTIQISANIAESDVGGITRGQVATFTVDAHRQNFQGEVQQVRMSASTVQNVVTFPVIIRAENPDLRLFPGMTANLGIETGRTNDAIIVPSAALRFTPEGAVLPEAPSGPPPGRGPGMGGGGEGGGPPPGMGGGGGRRGGGGGRGGPPGGRGGPSRIWLVGEDGKPEHVFVMQQFTDGSNVSVLPRDPGMTLEGREVILGVVTTTAATAANNPFVPRMTPGTGAGGGRQSPGAGMPR